MPHDSRSSISSRLKAFITQTDTRIAGWTVAEREVSVGWMRYWRRATYAFAVICTIIGCNHVILGWIGVRSEPTPEAMLFLHAAAWLAILYVITTWVWRMFQEGRLIGPVDWINDYPFDLLNVVG